MKQDMKEQLLTKSPLSLMFQLSIPAVIGMIVIGLYPLMDGIFAGNIIGQSAMTACGVALPLTFFNSGTSTLLGVGSASILSRSLGKGDRETVDKIMGNLIYFVILFSVIITVGGIILAPHFLDLVGASGEIKELGVRYLRVIFLGSIFVNFTQSANMVMRGEGLMKRAMGIMAMGAFINIILDPILMKAMGEYAIEGAAIATVVAQIIQAIVTLYYFKNKSENVKIGKIRKYKEVYKEMFGVGVSAMIMQVFFMIQQTLLYKQAFLYGGETNGILMAATLRIYAFSFIPLWGMSQGLQPVVGTNFGAKKFDRVRETMKVFSIGGLVLAAIFWIPVQIFTREILSGFNVSEEIISQGLNNLRLFYSVFILYGVMVMTITFFQAIGDGKKAGKIVMLRQLILFVPAMLILPKIFGSSAVWWAEPAVDLLMIIVGLIMQGKALSKMVKGN
ncbi:MULTISPECIES: MATE family efflux transporter [Bacillota]|uniref:Multidrug export protein MepA n=4 Tax=Peptoniphilaceae TaxID=1570339 RepID=A0A379C5D5_9FIRM|nr:MULTISPECIES: MATE family efflux transporter [Peptoniphilaceae]MBG8180759.1 MATE family efflux transporter [Enterococcus faecium]MDU1023745.1 MATE family efflux transporter [Peptoniphilus harei]MDU5503844.1 MATE family efflux transporter [Anaerococcus vaginalis]NSQ67333.1 MATE family efflux transporter [Enterococcus faecalis]HCQ5429407.1 MATE family efflux transporter [Clostridioides difficile]HEQ3735746.1 MATE family efflux transporter [Streptococcus pyogenes]